jgi:hypothetical protein
MRTKIYPVIVVFILVAMVFCSALNSMAADPLELRDLRKSYLVEKGGVANEDQRQEVINNYIDDLTSLVISMRGMRRDIKSVNAVREEIRKAQDELFGNSSSQTVKPAAESPRQTVTPATPEPVVEPPAPKAISPNLSPKPLAAAPVPKPADVIPAPKPAVAPVPKPAVVIPVPTPKPSPKQVPKPAKASLAPKAVVETMSKPAVTKKPDPKPKAVPKTVAAKPKPSPAPAPKPSFKPASKTVAVKPAPAVKPRSSKPAARRDPKIHVSSVQGMASAGDFSKNNVYSFNLTEVGPISTVKYWINGRFGIDSNGKVWLIAPDGSRENIGNWQEKASADISSGVTSYEELEPVSADVSKQVNSSGTYKVEFEWSEGAGPLYIYRVEIIS